jgi:PAS domain S-box-containing protein
MASLQANNETARLEALYRYEIVDTGAEEIFDNLVRVAALSCKTPIAAIALVDANRHWCKSSVGLELERIPRHEGLCSFCIEQRDLLIVNDTLTDSRFATNAVVTSYPHIRFYAGVPLITPDGYAIGVLSVADRTPRHLSKEQVEILGILSRQVMNELEQRRNLLVRQQVWSKPIGDRKDLADREESCSPTKTSDRSRPQENATQGDGSDRCKDPPIAEASLAPQQELLQTVLDSLPVGVWIANRQGSFLQGNPAAYRIWGIGGRCSIFDFGLGDGQPKIQNSKFSGWWKDTNKVIEPDEWGLFRAINKGETCLGDRIDIQCGDGTRKTILNSAIPLRNRQQEIIGAIVIDQDITEQQLVEKAFWENQRLIQQIADATPAILYIYDLIEQRNIYANRQVGEILGYSPETVQKMGSAMMPQLLHPSDRVKVAQHQQRFQTAKDGEILELEYRMRHVNGEWCWLHSRETVFARTADGLPLQLLGTATDITQRQQAEEELRESKERFQAAFESAAIGMALVSPGGRWLQVNLSLCEMLGYSERELVATTLDAIAHPEDLEPDLYYVRQILDSELRSCHMEKRCFHKSGRIVWVLLSFSLVQNATGEPLYFVVQIQDITKRKEAEQKIREQAALLDVATDAILVRSLDNQILFWNQGAQRLYGWKAKEVLGKNADQLLYKQISPELAAARAAVLAQGEWQGELKKVTKAGNEIIVQSRWTLMRDGAGQPKSILTVSTDITEKKKLESQFLRTQRLESIGTLAGGIAHDLNNVLAPILMSVQLLEKKLNDEASKRLLNTLENNAKRGADLVKQILSFARGIEAKRTLVQIRHLIAEIKQIAKETFPKSLEFQTDIPRDIWMLSGDATQLHQVFLNLCVNARDAMPSGGILSISAENKSLDENYARMHLEAKVGPYIVITVADTGMGIPPEVLERIFEPFFTTKDVGKGTGLGLSTVIGIVKSHGGFVQVQSEIGKGTQFKVFLPAIETIETPQLPEGFPALPGGKGELILVVDDEAAIREITKESLETYAYKVLTASDGIEAIALYAQHKQDIAVVLIDMMMPSMDGPTTIRLLQKMNPKIKIIAVSGLSSSYQFERVETIGVKAFLSKPYTAKELLKTIDSLLD